MITIIVAALVSAATTAGIYAYLHHANPDVAQKATDEVVSQIKEDATSVVDQIKEKI